MSRPSQTALQRYKVRRGAPPAPVRHRTNWPLLALLALVPVIVLILAHRRPGAPESVALTYELDLAAAPRGELGVTLMAVGSLPHRLDLGLAASPFSGAGPLERINGLAAWELGEQGERLRALPILRVPDGWRIDCGGVERLGVDYRMRPADVPGRQGDVRRHITAPVAGGPGRLRASPLGAFRPPARADPGAMGCGRPR